MNVLTARVALRDRPLVDVLDLSARFLVSHARPYAATFAVVVVPWFAVTWGIGEAVGWAWAWAAAAFASLFATAPFTALASRLVFEEHVRARDALRAAVRATPRLLLARAVQLLLFGAAFGFLVLPAAWVGAMFLVLPEVVVLEQTPVFTSIGRAQRITSGQLGDALAAVLLFVLMAGAAPILGDVVGRSVLEDLLEVNAPASLFSTGGGPLALAGFWVFVPLWTTFRFFLYINLRTRIEGWDVQTRFAALAARDGDEAPRAAGGVAA